MDLRSNMQEDQVGWGDWIAMDGGRDEAGIQSWLAEERLAVPPWMGPVSARVRGRDIWSTTSDLPWMPIYGSYVLGESIQSALDPGREDFLMVGAVGGFSHLYGKLGPLVVLISMSGEPYGSLCTEVWNLLAAQATASRSAETAEVLLAVSPERHEPQVFVRRLDESAESDGREPRGWIPLLGEPDGTKPNADDVMALVHSEVDQTRISALRALHTLMTESNAWRERRQLQSERAELARAREALLRIADDDVEQRVADEVTARMPWAPASMAESGWVRPARYAVSIRGWEHYPHVSNNGEGAETCEDHFCAAYRFGKAMMNVDGAPVGAWHTPGLSAVAERDPRSHDARSAWILIEDVLLDTTRMNSPFNGGYSETPSGMFVPWFRTWAPKVQERFDDLASTYADFLTELFRFIYPTGYSVDLSVEALRSAGYAIPEPWSPGPDDF